MNTTELTERLRDATDGLDVRPDFADAVLRGGRRRRARRRLTVVACVVATVAVTATVVTLRDDPPVPVADARLTQPTAGDLADDRAFLDEVRRVWLRDLPIAPEARDRYYDDVRGEPHVQWAGTTPAGRAAIVLQPVYVHPNSQVTEEGPRTAEGLVAVDPGDGRLKLVSTRMIGVDGSGQANYYRFGPDDRTMLVVDRGRPLHYDDAAEFITDRREIRFDWRRLAPDDGVAIVTTPDRARNVSPMVFEGDDPPKQAPIAELPVIPMPASRWLHLRLPDRSIRLPSTLLNWGNVLWRVGEPIAKSAQGVNATWGYFRHYPTDYEFVTSMWTIAAGLPDGRVVILKELQVGTAKPRLIAEVAANADTTDTVRVDGGQVDADAILPVRFHIPDDGGWIVADKGKELSYRTSPDEEWQAVGRDAALLPADATEVLVGDHYVRLA
ncbi:hypothetical protein [Actinophytocola sp. NPDC049390]|uniref:hypothetical protein n=1 Tax=Actinophytocola sp. NPDC049390 TaxID=3363894 RepID=UPI0037B16E3B